MTHTVTDDRCTHRCSECDAEFDCGRQPFNCRETRITPCEDCLEQMSSRRVEDWEHIGREVPHALVPGEE